MVHKNKLLTIAFLALVCATVFVLQAAFPKREVIPPAVRHAANLLMGKHNITGYKIDKIWDYNFTHARGIAIDSKGHVYVSEAYYGAGTNSRILKFDAEGNLLAWLGKGNLTTGWHDKNSAEQSLPGSGEGEFDYAFKIVFDQNDNMYVIDRHYYDSGLKQWTGDNERIQKFDPNGNFVAWLGKAADGSYGWHKSGSGQMSEQGAEDGALNDSTSICFSGNDMLVSSWVNNRVDKFSAQSGEYLGWLGKAPDGSYGWHAPGSGQSQAAPFFGTEEGAFNNPFDCRFNSKGQLYVVSYDSDPVLGIFDYASGKFLWGMYHLRDGYKPQNVILDKYDNIIFSDNYQGSIRFFSPQGTQTAALQLGPGGDYFAVGDFVFDKNGDLYFVEQQKQKVYKLTLIYQ